MRKILLILFLFFLSSLEANQTQREYPDFKKIVESTRQAIILKTKNYQAWQELLKEDTKAMENYDVKYYLIDINVDFENEFIIANNIVRFEVIDDSVSNILLHFTNNLIIDGIYRNSLNLAYTHEDNIIDIDLNGLFNSGDIVELNIQYHGYPETRLEDGLKFETHNGVPIAFTMVSPKGARKWWPCKDTPADKPDSIDIWITFPSEYVCASNGLLQEVIDNGDNTITNKWHESYPVATYLTSFAVTNYEIFSFEYEYNSQTMMVDNYIYPEQYSISVDLFSLTSEMLDFFSSIYGTYPFLSEKYGHAVCTNLGALAMEHQTCTSFQSSYITDPGAESTVAHELAHQWAGDCLTIGSWAHVWLKEGFARYSEALWAEHLYGSQGLHDFMNNLDNGSQLDPCLYRDPEGTASHIFNIVIYSKGGWTLHMLRGVLGEDDFSQTIYEFMQEPNFMYGNILTEDLENCAESVSGMELDWFFDQWFYNEGRPRYKYTTYTSDEYDSLRITLFSEGSHGDPFAMYIPYMLNNQEGRVWADSGFNYCNVSLVGNLDSLIWDPDNWVLDYGYEEQIPELEEIIPGKGSILLTWNEFFDPNIEGFNIYRKESGGEYLQINSQPVNDIMYFDEGLTNGQTYFYKITAVTSSNGNYISKFSNEVSAIPVDFSLDQGIFVIDETNNTNPAFPTDAEVDSFYNYLLDNYSHTDWDTEELGIPPLSELVKYSSIIWHSDELIDSHLGDNPYLLKSYLLAGGNLFISGWKHLSNIPPDIYQDYLHITNPVYNTTEGFAGAFGGNGFPYLDIDINKVPPLGWGDYLKYIYKFETYGDAEIIYRFDSTINDSCWENKPCAIKYSNNYKLYFLGFPLYYMNIDASAQLIEIALQDFGEDTPVSDNYNKFDNIFSLTNYPNPFFPETKIRFQVPQGISNQVISLYIYNIRGQLIKKFILTNSELQEYELIWNGKDMNSKYVNSGIYFIALRIGNFISTNKIILLK
ncbi:MAG: T9SS type A sorting domain-containing protein [Candidatus Cloacimonetes bacterium]|nr:T9SS type A sorting domain-containing protein [Candidatus Cloacimonadota bacterium]